MRFRTQSAQWEPSFAEEEPTELPVSHDQFAGDSESERMSRRPTVCANFGRILFKFLCWCDFFHCRVSHFFAFCCLYRYSMCLLSLCFFEEELSGQNCTPVKTDCPLFVDNPRLVNGSQVYLFHLCKLCGSSNVGLEVICLDFNTFVSFLKSRSLSLLCDK